MRGFATRGLSGLRGQEPGTAQDPGVDRSAGVVPLAAGRHGNRLALHSSATRPVSPRSPHASSWRHFALGAVRSAAPAIGVRGARTLHDEQPVHRACHEWPSPASEARIAAGGPYDVDAVSPPDVELVAVVAAPPPLQSLRGFEGAEGG